MQLEQFKIAKMVEIRRLRQLESIDMLPLPRTGRRASFAQALPSPSGRARVIAEFKRASPSRGVIRMELSAEEVARQYAEAGASCLSVLTEERFFRGSIRFLSRMETAGLPLLRKDFIFDPLQIEATAATPASALLLIVRLTPEAKQLRALREQAEQYGMDAVVEVFDETDLYLARESGARIIQVNARDLATLQVDRGRCLRLAEQYRKNGAEEVWIAASGMAVPEHLRQAENVGYDAVLVGTSLMEGGRPGEALKRLLEASSTLD